MTDETPPSGPPTGSEPPAASPTQLSLKDRLRGIASSVRLGPAKAMARTQAAIMAFQKRRADAKTAAGAGDGAITGETSTTAKTSPAWLRKIKASPAIQKLGAAPGIRHLREAEWPGKLRQAVGRKAEQWHLKEKLVRLMPQDLAKTFPKTFEPLAVAEWLSKAFQKQGAAFYGTLLTLLLCTYFLADIAALLLGNFIPEPPIARTARNSGYQRRVPSIADYEVIFARNLFNSSGLIPGETEGQPEGAGDPGGTPVKTTLPFTLLGTIIMHDENRSIATIEDKSAAMVYPVRVTDEIPDKARIISIEANRVVFLNVSANRREFVEITEEASGNPKITVGSRAKVGGVERLSPTQFNVSRVEVDKALADLNQVLTQARAVPNFENGMPAGYKLFQIVPGSIYDKLGLQNGDTICGLNGNNVNDPGKAFEMLGELKTSSHLELCVKRDGKKNDFAYDIR